MIHYFIIGVLLLWLARLMEFSLKDLLSKAIYPA